jgi:glutaredoxin
MVAKLYTTPQCVPCKRVKQYIAINKLDVKIIDDMTKFPPNLRSVPMLVVDGEFTNGDVAVIQKLKELDEPQ